MIEEGNFNDTIYAQLKKEIAEEKAQREQQKQKANEENRLYQIEKQKPCNAIPRLSKYEHVPENEREYRAYIENCDLTLLEMYRDQMAKGQHKSEYRNDMYFNKVLNFLTLQINIRKNPVPFDKNLSIRQVIAQERTKIDADKLELKAQTDKIEGMKSDLKKELQKIVNPDSTQSQKAYTT